jgi:hypothetical protein
MTDLAMQLELMKYVLPREIVDDFSLVSIQEEPYQESVALHLYFEEHNVPPEEYHDVSLSSNGFYPSSTIKDFPLRDKKVVLHVRRRRWVDESGKSYSRRWDLTADGTRYSKEFASFLKEEFGYSPDHSPIP